ncbi:GNAT family N-acetyltransferase [Bacillus spongiae]|uniref:GNAT family N-acetyltransferase n=1 Tax=Bacillus spongiae TaxID=2683610 RepID=A0ABU8HIR2_9BACI
MKIVYRRAEFDDMDQLFPLAESLATSFQLNRTDFSSVFLELLKDPNADILLAEIDSKLIGYVLAFHHATFYANGEVTWVEEVFVSAEYRGDGVGKRLMDKVEELSLKRGSKLVALATRRAHQFYSAIGYEESATYYKKTLVDEK